MRECIELEGMEFKAYHGCYELEKVVGNRFRVDVTLDAETGECAQNDTLEGNVNYLTVYQTVKKEMSIKSNTIENVALRIANALREQFPQVLSARVKVSKLAPPLGGKTNNVSVTVTK